MTDNQTGWTDIVDGYNRLWPHTSKAFPATEMLAFLRGWRFSGPLHQLWGRTQSGRLMHIR